MNSHINAALKLAIIMSGRTQGRVAKLAKMSPVRLSRIVQGREPAKPEQMTRLAAVLERAEHELFGGAL
jgi:transcriptional regulator with XRE-family HTH domain